MRFSSRAYNCATYISGLFEARLVRIGFDEPETYVNASGPSDKLISVGSELNRLVDQLDELDHDHVD